MRASSRNIYGTTNRQIISPEAQYYISDRVTPAPLNIIFRKTNINLAHGTKNNVSIFNPVSGVVLLLIVIIVQPHIMSQPVWHILLLECAGLVGPSGQYFHDRFDQIASCRFHDNLAFISPFDWTSSVINPGQEGQR
ncbi:hypothetical protein [Aeromonas dhakensis]|uniref:hypothetical protein n=1 Tax=Aeromonas dhakensis TaxID=196024 RepID=UPI0039877619